MVTSSYPSPSRHPKECCRKPPAMLKQHFPTPQHPIGYPLRLLGSFRLGVGSVQESLLHSLRLIDVSHIDH